MSDNNSHRFVVARYLRDHGYDQTLQAFLAETGLPDSIGTKPGDWNLEQILQEKSLYDQNLNYEKGPAVAATGWSTPCPEISLQPETSGLANTLSVTASKHSSLIVASFVNNTLGFWNSSRPFRGASQGLIKGNRNILSSSIAGEYLITSKMDGFVDFHDLSSCQLLASIKLHSSYTVQVISTWDEDRLVIATAGWDSKASIFSPSLSALASARSGAELDPLTTLPTVFESHAAPSNVQSLLFVRHPDTAALYLVYTRRDSIYLHYLLLTTNSQQDGSTRYTATSTGRQSLAPQQHSTWISFTPSHIESCPTDPTLVAVATSHTPSMKLIITRLIFPEDSQPVAPAAIDPAGTGNYGTKDELAIRLVANTNAPQNDYSTPRCVWRPDGTGVWVSGDDGVVRGIDASTGKVVKELRDHESGAKIRCLWAGMLDRDGRTGGEADREVLISGGFDRKLLVWEVE